MKRFLYFFSSFIVLNCTLLTHQASAQTVDDNVLLPIISLILSEQTNNIPPVPNDAPVNRVAEQPLKLDLNDPSTLFFPLSVNVNDKDGNLSSIKVTLNSTENALIDLDNRSISDITFDDRLKNGFIMTGTQEALSTAISNGNLILIAFPLDPKPLTITVTIKSTDEQRAFDKDSFSVNVIDSNTSSLSKRKKL